MRKDEQTMKKVSGIRLRTIPNPLFNALRSLSTVQEQCLTDMGFEGLIGMKPDGIPSNLALSCCSKLWSIHYDTENFKWDNTHNRRSSTGHDWSPHGSYTRVDEAIQQREYPTK